MHVQKSHLRLAALAAAAVLALSACSSGSGSSENGSDDDQEIGALAATCLEDYSGDLASAEKSYPEAENADLKIGFSSPLAANEFVNYLQKFVEREVEASGGTTVAFDAAGQPDTQVTQMEQLLNDGVDAIIVFPLDASALKPVVAKAKAQGVPVIGMEVEPDATSDIGDFTTQVVQGRDLHAYLQACVMAELHPGGEVATIGFGVPVPSILAFVDRVKFWSEEFGLEVVDSVDNATDDVAGGEKVASGLLAKHPELKGVFAYNDPSAIGVSIAARSQSRQVTAFGLNGGSDAFAAVESGKEQMSLQFPASSWAAALVQAAYASVQSPDVELPTSTYPAQVKVLAEDTLGDAQTWEDELGSD